ncbi:MAG: SEC-C domain-containing protein [Gemmatimonadota bacterium]|nr:SEC-C domain-containing protein [Gemmatimonadota bacterium]
MADVTPDPINAIEKQLGVTAAEKYLERLCAHTFLNLWSYPTVYRNQLGNATGDGKEIADLLVVFGNDIVIFSDKSVSWSTESALEVAWGRWYRRAVLGGAKQVWGAARWLADHPDRVFLDRACLRPFPYLLPRRDMARYHCVVVAHGASSHCRAVHGGSGSLMWAGGDAATSAIPFTLSDLDPSQPFVHVLDDTTLDIVLRECDTITDFVAYLTKKEALLRSARFVVHAGEEELLAFYLKNLNTTGEHDFVFDEGVDGIAIPEGEYAEYQRNPQLARKRAADRESYFWDSLIERFSENLLAGTLHPASRPEVATSESALRLLARESRVRRRLLGGAFFGLLKKAHDGQQFMYARVVEPSGPEDPFYVFFLLRKRDDTSEEEYRSARQAGLLQYCRVLRLDRPSATTIVGVGANVPTDAGGSEDLLVYDGTNFTETERDAALAGRAIGMLTRVNRSATVIEEYPGETQPVTSKLPQKGGRFPGTGRNELCPCGRGMKYKKCCGP